MWKWQKGKWVTDNWQKMYLPGVAVLYGAGPSLNTADLEEKGAVRFVQNNAVKKVKPHIWIGMDKADFFGTAVFNSSYPKICRGPHSDDMLRGKPLKQYRDVHFADTFEREFEHIWNTRPDVKFVWTKKTLMTSIHIILWMGFREIYFSGIDLHGDYFDGAEIADRAENDRVRDEEFRWMKQFAEEAKNKGVTLINRSPSSRLTELMETIT